VFDLTAIYRRSYTRVMEVWSLQIKNLLAVKKVVMDYNFATSRVEEVKEGFPPRFEL
jgi:hypothetical protein